MIVPSPEVLPQDKYNRYMLVIAVSKCARMVTDEYVHQREIAEKLLATKESDKTLCSLIKKEYRDENAIRTAVVRLNEGKCRIVDSSIGLTQQN